MKAKQKLGDLLVASGTIDAAQLTAALGEQKSWGRPLGMTLVRMGFVDEDTLIHALASQLKLPIVKLAGKVVNQEVLDLVPIELAEKYRCLPLLLNDEGGQKAQSRKRDSSLLLSNIKQDDAKLDKVLMIV